VGQADSGQFLACAVLGMVHARQFERGHDIFQRRHRGQQVKRLKHHADAPAPARARASSSRAAKS
jgi:hypothetical protein